MRPIRVIFLITTLLWTSLAEVCELNPRCDQEGLLSKNKIVGGYDITIMDAPYQVQLEIQGCFACGGSIINKNHVLTAAHCTDGRKAEDIKVRSGTSCLGQDGVLSNVMNIAQSNSNSLAFKCGDVENEAKDYDVSVLTLSEPLIFNDATKAISLTDTNPLDQAELLVSGWGLTTENGKLSPQLQAVKVPTIGREECKQIYGEAITETMLCAGRITGGQDACTGDSGGPAVVNGVQVGIVSWGCGCAREGYTGVYSSVAVLKSFIDDNSSSTIPLINTVLIVAVMYMVMIIM